MLGKKLKQFALNYDNSSNYLLMEGFELENKIK